MDFSGNNILETEEKNDAKSPCLKWVDNHRCIVIVVLLSIICALIMVLVIPNFIKYESTKSTAVKTNETNSNAPTLRFQKSPLLATMPTLLPMGQRPILERFSSKIFNKEKIEVKLTYTLKYVAFSSGSKYLNDTYGLGNLPLIRRAAIDNAVKIAAIQFSVNDYLYQKQNVSAALLKAARRSLSGECCFSDCKHMQCFAGCKPYHTCADKDKGMFAYVNYFKLEKDFFPTWLLQIWNVTSF